VIGSSTSGAKKSVVIDRLPVVQSANGVVGRVETDQQVRVAAYRAVHRQRGPGMDSAPFAYHG
jgi:hypothetical protein